MGKLERYISRTIIGVENIGGRKIIRIIGRGHFSTCNSDRKYVFIQYDDIVTTIGLIQKSGVDCIIKSTSKHSVTRCSGSELVDIYQKNSGDDPIIIRISDLNDGTPVGRYILA